MQELIKDMLEKNRVVYLEAFDTGVKASTKSLIGALRAALEKSPDLTGAEVLDILEVVTNERK
jgi:hypothetical protein